MAYQGDNSESTKSIVQQIRVKLEEAKSDLQESEYEKYIQDQERLYDDLMSDVEAWINGRLDEIDGLVSQAIEATNANASSINSTIDTVANALGITLSETMTTIWGSEENALNGVHNVVKEYGDILYGTQGTINDSITNGTTTVQNALKDIDNDILKMIEILNAEAKVNAESIAQQQEQAEHSQDNNNTYEYVPEPEQTSQSNKVTLGGGLFYEDSYKGGKTGNSVSQWTGREVEVTHTSGTGMVHIIDAETGTVLGWVDPNQLNGYATGTTNAKKGFNLVSEKGDEIIKDNDGNIILARGEQIFPFEGGETVFNAAKTAELLNGNLMPLSEGQLWRNILKTPKLPDMANRGVGGSVTNYNQFSFDLPNVVDANSLIDELQHSKRFEKIVQSMTIDQALNKNSLFKNKL